MVGTILPIGYGEQGERKNWTLPGAIFAHSAGSILGGALTGGLLAALRYGIGSLLPDRDMGSLDYFTVGTASLVLSANELGLIKVRLPQSHWQVPRRWSLVLSPHIASLLYGMVLGTGLATAIPIVTFYVAAAWAVLLVGPLTAVLIIAAFGVGRALPLIVMAAVVRTSEEERRLSRGLHRWQPAVHVLNGLTLAATGAWLLTLCAAGRSLVN
jgi:hypothetical protein